ncbi:hypothetical protein BJQ94_09900 [Cryobacterium sp. SO2]|uniref:hypothetical protein n=1 Tax=Cryobacterium sp. SO2 TaxID=1897060 RepID=UPI00223DE40B|nr:hypothetical protein [Cryobacterium sp. SO2]WEO75713.1 hypothetical protein BJQ94_09900 [Cryobacterium sp. SO2]
MTTLVPAALTEADLPLAELACARLDGELFGLAGSWCPIDAPDGPETRAGALQRTAPHRAAAERLTAAWIYGLAPEPAEHQFCVDVGARTVKHPGSGVCLREVRLGDADAVLLGRLLVTTPLRTAVDLARWGTSRDHPADTGLIAALLAHAGLAQVTAGDARTPPADDASTAAAVVSGLRGISFTRVAQAQLRDAFRLLGAQPSLTR